MPRLHVDLNEAQSRKPVPDDRYLCTITEISSPQQGEKSTYVMATMEVSDGEFSGHKFFSNLPITGRGAGIFADFYSKATGEDVDVDELEELDVDTDDLIGQEIGVVNAQEEYPENSGEFRDRVKRFLKA